MRPLLLALPLSLALSTVHAGDHDHDHAHGHDNPGAHEHGVALLDVVLEGQVLSIELHSPAINLVGFEHAPTSDEERARVARARQALSAPLPLFGIPDAAGCTLAQNEQSSPLFGSHDDREPEEDGHDEHDHDSQHGGHADVDAHYQLNCRDVARLKGLDLGGFFDTFPQTERLQAQVIGPNGQQGLQLAPGQARIAF